MTKRSWSQVDGADGHSFLRLSAFCTDDQSNAMGVNGDSPLGSFAANQSSNGHHLEEIFPKESPQAANDKAAKTRIKSQGRVREPQTSATLRIEQEHQYWPSITRKVKACAACRKQKIKCIMDDEHPPCRRCKERNLSCILNKSLQTLIDDESRWKKTVGHDLATIHAALEQTLRSLSLPGLPPLHTELPEAAVADAHLHEESSSAYTETTQLVDPCPRQLLSDDTLAQVPIESLYEITRLRSLRSGAMDGDRNGVDDFISRGLIRLADAERLFQFYISNLDPYIYGIASKYKDLKSLRKSSSILTVCICAVSACHQADDGKLYEACHREFQRLVSSSMFDRRVSLEYLRALCIGTYWLSDISWTLSGYAIRRASDVDLHRFYYRIIDSTSASPAVSPASWDHSDPESSIEPVRLWYLLYICDQHLSILYNRHPLIRDDETIRGWMAYLESPHASRSDTRICSQVALMSILGQVRELFGMDANKPIPRPFVTHLSSFNQQLDKWLSYWSQKLEPNEHIGDFPTKGLLLHYHFGKLHLYSHVFRGLKFGEHIDPIPLYFKDAASTAVYNATTTLELLLDDPDLRRSLIGVPHYFHTMIAFACVVLLKVADRYSADLSIDVGSVYLLIVRVIDLLRSNSCSRYHLVHWMAEGLEKMLRVSKVLSKEALSTQWDAAGGLRLTTAVEPGTLFHLGQQQLTPQSSTPTMDLSGQMDKGSLLQPPAEEQEAASGPSLPMLEILDSDEYDLNGLSFNFL